MCHYRVYYLVHNRVSSTHASLLYGACPWNGVRVWQEKALLGGNILVHGCPELIHALCIHMTLIAINLYAIQVDVVSGKKNDAWLATIKIR